MKSICFYIFLMLSFTVLNFGCSKEKWPRVKLRVVTHSSANIAYKMTSNKLNVETVSGDWSVSFREKRGKPIFISAIHSGVVGTTNIIVYINGVITFSKSTNQPGEMIVIDTTVP